MKYKFKEKNIDFKVRFTNEFQEEWNQVISLTDMAMLPTIHYKDNYFDLAIVDPPYGIGIAKNGNLGKNNFTKKDWDDLQEGKEIDVKQIGDGIKDLVEETAKKSTEPAKKKEVK